MTDAVPRLRRAHARRIAVRAQLLDARRPTDALTVVERLTVLQVDPAAVFGPTPDLVLWSRLGSGYDRMELQSALDGRALWEHDGLIRPMDDVPLFLAEMARSPTRSGARRWLEDNDAFRADILRVLAERGPLTAKEIPDTSRVPWPSSGWNNDKNVAMMLELLAKRGEVAVSRRIHGVRAWDVAERVLPPVDPVPLDEALRIRADRKLRSLGIARAKGLAVPNDELQVGDAGVPVEVEGTPGTWRAHPELLDDDGFEGRTALLSPFDRLVYDRKRAQELFGFEYAVEMYKPASARRWGYFALPILHGERLIGKLDASVDRDRGDLVVHAVHEDEPFGADVAAAVDAEIDDLARWLRLEPRR